MTGLRRIATYLAIPILFLMVFNLGKSVIETYNSSGKVDVLAQEIDYLKKEEQVLDSELEYRKSDDFVEKEARDRLHMIKPGEVVVNIAVLEEPQDIVVVEQQHLTIPQQWRGVFGL